jgi:hypothetical protein
VRRHRCCPDFWAKRILVERVFYPVDMATGESDRILLARISGTASRLACVREWSPEIEAAAVSVLREMAGGRADLLAEEAGLRFGTGEGRMDEEWCRRRAALCVAAGADKSQIESWIEVGRERARAAKKRPYTGTGEPG